MWMRHLTMLCALALMGCTNDEPETKTRFRLTPETLTLCRAADETHDASCREITEAEAKERWRMVPSKESRARRN
jgi:hypothetical protein